MNNYFSYLYAIFEAIWEKNFRVFEFLNYTPFPELRNSYRYTFEDSLMKVVRGYLEFSFGAFQNKRSQKEVFIFWIFFNLMSWKKFVGVCQDHEYFHSPSRAERV